MYQNRIFSSLVLFVLILLINSCQTPNEPVLDIPNVNVCIKVETIEGNPLPSMNIKYKKGKFEVSNSLIFGNGVTNSNGMVCQTMPISSEGDIYSFQISTNAYNNIPKQYLDKIYEFNIACKDSIYIIKVPMVIDVPCNQSLPDINPKNLIVCPKVKKVDSIGVGPICINCDSSLSISFNEPANNKYFKILIKDENGTILTGNPFTLKPNQCFYSYLVFDTKGELLPNKSEQITFNVNTDKITYRLVTINYNAESVCSECTCPNDFTLTWPNDTTYYELCSNETTSIGILLKQYLNTNTKCDLKFSLDKDFSNKNLFELISFNNNNYTLSPNSNLDSIKFRFKGNAIGKFTDSIIFKIQTYNPDYNLYEPCNSKLKIKLNLNIIDGQCQFDLNSEIFKGFKSIDSTHTFNAGIGTADIKSIGIVNPSSCPLIITGYSILDKVSQGRPFELIDGNGNPPNFPIQIPPKTTKFFFIRFRPDPKDAYPPDGIRKNNLVEEFKTKLSFTTSSQNCNLGEVPLHGKIITKNANFICVAISSDKFRQGIQFTDQGALVADTNKFYVYFENYDPVKKEVDLVRTTTSDNKVYVYMAKLPTPLSYQANTQNICDIAVQNNSLCDVAATNSSTNVLRVGINDIIAFTYSYIDSKGNIITYCAIIVITSMSDEPGLNNSKVCFVTCMGI